MDVIGVLNKTVCLLESFMEKTHQDCISPSVKGGVGDYFKKGWFYILKCLENNMKTFCHLKRHGAT